MGTQNEFLRTKWKCLITEQAESGKSRKAWCRDNEVSYESFKYWINKFRKEQLMDTIALLEERIEEKNAGTISEQPAKDSTFVELSPAVINRAADAGATVSPAAVIRSGNMTVELYPTASPSFIRHVIEVMHYV